MKSSPAPLAHWNCQALKEHVCLLQQLSDEDFLYSRAPVFPSAIGSHLRHDLDHYLNFIKGLDGRSIDYESRIRDPELETNRSHAIQVIEDILKALNQLNLPESTPLKVRVEEDEHCVTTPSTLRRELDFLLSHTIHHQAIISMMVRDMGRTPSATYGIAPSTLRHIRQASCAQ